MNEIEKVKKDKKKAEAKEDWKEYAGLCNYLGQLLCKNGDYEAALAEHKFEKEVCTFLGDTIGVAVAHRRIGECYSELDQFHKALSNQERHLFLAKDLNNEVEEQRAWATIGRTYLIKFQKESQSSQGPEESSAVSLKKAQKAFWRALELCHKLEDRASVKEIMEMKNRLLLNIGLIYDEQNELNKCIEFIQKAISINEKYEFWEDLHRCHYSLATIYQKHNKMSESLKYMDLALTSSSRLKDEALVCEALLGKAEILSILGDFGGAEIHLKQAYRKKSPVEEDRIKIEKRLKVVIKLHRFEQKILKSSSGTDEELMALYEKMADGCVHLSAFSQAIKYYHKMLGEHEKLKNSSKDITVIYSSLAHTYLDNKQPEEALKYFKLELQCSNESKEKGRIFVNMAVAAESSSSFASAKGYYRQACSFAREAADLKLVYKCLKALILLYGRDDEVGEVENANREIKNLKDEDGFISEDNEESDEDEFAQDVDLSYVSDLSDNEDGEDHNRVKRRRVNAKHKVNEVGETPLHRACITGNLKAVKQLLIEGCVVNPRDFCGWLPIHEACNHDHYEIVKELIAHGAWINDRGGKDCDGITPLHDAASCGNTDIMRLLIENGASLLAVSSSGESPLDSLRSWRNRTELEPQLMDDCLLLEKDLTEKILKVCRDISSPKRISEENSESTSKPESLSSQSSAQRFKLLEPDGFSDEISVVNVQTPFIDRSVEEKKTGMLDSRSKKRKDLDTKGRATKIYKDAILQVRSSATTGCQKTSSNKTTTEKEAAHRTALIDADEAAGENWLVDDLYSENNRRNPLLDWNKQYQNNSTSRTINNQKRSLVQENASSILPESDKSKTSKQKHQNDASIKQQNAGEKRNTFDVLRSDINRDSMENEAVTSTTNMAPRSEDCSLSFLARYVKNDAKDDKTTSNVIRVKVKVLDKAFLIPTGGDKMVSWLASEVSNRFFQLTGQRPILSLTLDGALMHSNDVISQIVFPNEEIVGKIESWDLPPLSDCYDTACKILRSFFYRNIKTRLLKCEESGELNLSNMLLGMINLRPVFHAIQYHHTIQYLHIDDNKLDDNEVDNLTAALATLPSLLSLKINNNNFTSKTIQSFSNIQQPENSPLKPLKMLNELDLSANPLGDSCSTALGNFISKLGNLKKLNLSSCNFTGKLFGSHLQRILAEQTSITELIFTNNFLSGNDIDCFLRSLNCQSIARLDLSGTTASGCPETICRSVGRYASQENCSLQHLVLADCNLNEDNITLLARELKTAVRLGHLSLAQNRLASFNSIERLLNCTKGNPILLHTLDLTGCAEFFTRLESNKADEFSRLLKANSFRDLRFARDDVSSQLHRLMVEAWRKNWGHRAVTQVLPDCTVRFSVD